MSFIILFSELLRLCHFSAISIIIVKLLIYYLPARQRDSFWHFLVLYRFHFASPLAKPSLMNSSIFCFLWVKQVASWVPISAVAASLKPKLGFCWDRSSACRHWAVRDWAGPQSGERRSHRISKSFGQSASVWVSQPHSYICFQLNIFPWLACCFWAWSWCWPESSCRSRSRTSAETKGPVFRRVSSRKAVRRGNPDGCPFASRFSWAWVHICHIGWGCTYSRSNTCTGVSKSTRNQI